MEKIKIRYQIVCFVIFQLVAWHDFRISTPFTVIIYTRYIFIVPVNKQQLSSFSYYFSF